MIKRKAEIKERKRLLDAFFKVDQIEIEMTSTQGESMQLRRLVFERGHAASVLLYDPVRDSVVLISEMRPGILSAGEDDPFSLSIVAGMRDNGADNLVTIRKEALEESGIKIDEVILIHPGMYVSPGGTSEKIGVYCALVDSSTAKPFCGVAAEGEDIQTHVVSFRQFMHAIDHHQITDMKTVFVGYWLRQNRAKLRKVQLQPEVPA